MVMKEPVYPKNMLPALARMEDLQNEEMSRIAAMLPSWDEMTADALTADLRHTGHCFYRIGVGSVERIDPQDVFTPPA